MSDVDIFSPGKSPVSRLSKSLPGGEKLSKTNYHWLLTFHCDPDDEFPFSHWISTLFRDGSVPTNWFKGKLTDEARMQNRTMPALPGENSYRVFAKIEKGTCTVRIKETVEMLNKEFRELVDKDMEIDAAYEKLVQSHPYKLLSSFEYLFEVVSIRSNRRKDAPSETDVSFN